jgi:mono/diheme cytochrome c family protein
MIQRTASFSLRAALLAVAVASTAAAQDGVAPDAAALFAENCASCHGADRLG